MLNPSSKHTPAPVTLGRDVSMLGKALRRQGDTPPGEQQSGTSLGFEEKDENVGFYPIFR